MQSRFTEFPDSNFQTIQRATAQRQRAQKLLQHARYFIEILAKSQYGNVDGYRVQTGTKLIETADNLLQVLNFLLYNGSHFVFGETGTEGDGNVREQVEKPVQHRMLTQFDVI